MAAPDSSLSLRPPHPLHRLGAQQGAEGALFLSGPGKACLHHQLA